VPLVFILPDEINEGLSEKLNENLKSYTKQIHHHPMDILKVLRDRLELNKQFDSEKSIEKIENELSSQEQKIKVKPTVLVVDDDNDALFTVGEYLKEMNYDTVFAHNGMECLIMLNHVNPDLILLDIMMPQMDGFETIKRIRNDNRFSKLPIIALTAYAMLENKDVIEKNGFDDIITKPISSQTLQQKINKYIS
jgi:CheY-like chemotaxis protein